MPAPDTLKKQPKLNSTDLIITSDEIHEPLNSECKSLKPLIDANDEFSYKNKVEADFSSNISIGVAEISLNTSIIFEF